MKNQLNTQIAKWNTQQKKGSQIVPCLPHYCGQDAVLNINKINYAFQFICMSVELPKYNKTRQLLSTITAQHKKKETHRTAQKMAQQKEWKRVRWIRADLSSIACGFRNFVMHVLVHDQATAQRTKRQQKSVIEVTKKKGKNTARHPKPHRTNIHMPAHFHVKLNGKLVHINDEDDPFFGFRARRQEAEEYIV